jgi:hypothetical protein
MRVRVRIRVRIRVRVRMRFRFRIRVKGQGYNPWPRFETYQNIRQDPVRRRRKTPGHRSPEMRVSEIRGF